MKFIMIVKTDKSVTQVVYTKQQEKEKFRSYLFLWRILLHRNQVLDLP